MLNYFFRRILQVIPVFLGATFLIYVMVFLMPGDPVVALGGDKGLTPEAIARIKAEYNLDKPFLVQYFLYLKNILLLNFGKTFSGVDVITIIKNAFPVTVQLAFLSVFFEALFGIFFGFIAGIKRGKFFDSCVLIVSLVIIAVPTFVTGFVLQFILGVKFRIFPTTVGFNVSFYSLLLPAIVLGSISFAYVLRLTRSSIIENLDADYVRTAKAKGISNTRLMIVHVLRNSLIPVITFLGADLGNLMAGAIVTEGIFGINGIGGVLYQAILKGEPTTVVSITTILVLIYIATNLLVDLFYIILDPRIKYE